MISGLLQPVGRLTPCRQQFAFCLRPRLSRGTFRTVVLLATLALWLLYVYSNNGYNTSSSTSPLVLSSLSSSTTRSSMFGAKEPILKNSNTYMDPYGWNGVGGLECNDPDVDKVNVTRCGDYVVLNNLIRRNRCFGYTESVTLTTHGTYELLDNLPFLSHRWQGAISVAVYTPATDLQVATEYALWLRRCHSDIAEFVTFHFVFPEYPDLMAANQNVTLLSNGTYRPEEVLTESPDSVHGTDGLPTKFDYVTVLKGLPVVTCSRNCNMTKYQLPKSYRTRNGLPYPINVCRNVARLNARTHFVLASDIELYPNANVIPRFLAFANRAGLFKNISAVLTNTPFPSSSVTTSSTTALSKNITASLPSTLAASNAVTNDSMRRIYVLPIFEVDRSVKEVPISKAVLLDLYRRKKAVYFHKHVCSYCNIIPKLNQWLLLKSPPQLGVFLVVKRHKPYHRWEPIYIGTNAEPLYDERLTWEGQQDKMTQMYELCLMDYDVALLDDAFLVHRPGIKKKIPAEYKRKASYIKRNNRIYLTAIRQLEAIHGADRRCK